MVDEGGGSQRQSAAMRCGASEEEGEEKRMQKSGD